MGVNIVGGRASFVSPRVISNVYSKVYQKLKSAMTMIDQIISAHYIRYLVFWKNWESNEVQNPEEKSCRPG